MDKQALKGAAAGALITTVIAAIVGGIFGWFGEKADDLEAGEAAINREQIETIVDEMLTERLQTDSGETLMAVMSEVRDSQIANTATLEAIRDDVDDLEAAVLALTR